VIIVTGRRWDDLNRVVPQIVPLCTRIVCEHGGVLVNVETGQLTLLADPVEPELIAGVRAADVDELDVGLVAVSASLRSLATLTAIRDRIGSKRVIIVNKGSVALAPPGCDKASGLRAAVAELRLDGTPILAIGDAENDLPMFAIATIAVGVANADDAVRAAGVPLTTASVGRGVAEALDRFLPRPVD
jgi:hydroxymethylpyrimidine pyrophosphatase-like HAD family hydrolase